MTYTVPAVIPLWRRDFLAGFALVSPEDEQRVSEHIWLLTTGGYALSTTNVLMHRLIAGDPEGEVVDHMNGSRTDNRRENLRVCSQQMNMCNTRRPKKKLRGVSIDKRQNPPAIRSDIAVKGKRIALGTFPSEVEAARAYDSAARQLHGEFATLNFPDEIHYSGIDWIERAQLSKENGPVNRKLSGEAVEVIQQRLAAGEIPNDLAEEYKVSKQLIYFVANGVREGQKHVEPEWMAQAIERVRQGEAISRVAKEMDISLHILRRRAKQMTDKPETVYKRRADAKLTPEQVQNILRRVAVGEQQKALAREYGVSLSLVNGYVRGKRRM